MIQFKTAGIVAFALAVSACGGDDPNNVPLYGEWEIETKLDSVTIDGIAFMADELPTDFREIEGTERECGEPIYTDRNWQAEDIARRTKGQCQLGDYSHTKTGARFSGQCVVENRDGKYTPKVTGRSSLSEDSVRDVITMSGTITMEGDNSPHVLKMIMVQEGKRLGDC